MQPNRPTQPPAKWADTATMEDIHFILWSLAEIRRFNRQFRIPFKGAGNKVLQRMLQTLDDAAADDALWKRVPKRFRIEKGLLPKIRKEYLLASGAMTRALAAKGKSPAMQFRFQGYYARAYLNFRARLMAACGREGLRTDIRETLARYRLATPDEMIEAAAVLNDESGEAPRPEEDAADALAAADEAADAAETADTERPRDPPPFEPAILAIV